MVFHWFIKSSDFKNQNFWPIIIWFLWKVIVFFWLFTKNHHISNISGALCKGPTAKSKITVVIFDMSRELAIVYHCLDSILVFLSKISCPLSVRMRNMYFWKNWKRQSIGAVPESSFLHALS